MTTLPQVDNLPAEIRASTRTVVWKFLERGGKSTKVPFQAHAPNTTAAVDRPETWAEFQTAYDSVADGKADGIGIILGDGLAGVDLDGVRDPKSGEITAAARTIISMLDSYTEVSPSGCGVHVLVNGELPAGRRKRNGIEMYGSGRYFTLTGQHLPGTPLTIHERTDVLARLHAEVFPPAPDRPKTETGSDNNPVSDPVAALSDPQVMARAMTARNAARFVALWDGDTSAYDGDDSAADLALCNLLCFWVGRDADRIDRLFRQSALMREKWDSKRGTSTYGRDTVQKAIADCRETFTPGVTIELDEDSPPAEPAATAIVDTLPVLHADALIGIFGDLVQALTPKTEASAVALLGHALVLFGNLIGRSPYAKVGASQHHANENVLIVGSTSSARKGLAFAETRAVLGDVDRDWDTMRVQTGLSTGEGLIYHVRDPRESRTPIKEKGRVVRHETVIDDTGVTDKRLCVVEPEFGRTLRVSRREHNTLSAAVRQAWDSGDLRVLTRNSPVIATGAHVSVVGHITPRELRDELKTADMASGFANRFLFLLVTRSQPLPDGGSLDSDVHDALVRRLVVAVDVARKRGLITRDDQANALWHRVYGRLSRERVGLVGDLCARAPAHVLRLSLLYALADSAAQIAETHLRAAIAVWDYAERSVSLIFRKRTGDKLSDFLLAILWAYPDGRTRTELSAALGRNKGADEIHAALIKLQDLGLARFELVPTKGRAIERWFASALYD